MTHSHDTATPALSVESEKALRPFADAVFNDNGDMTVSPVTDYDAYVNAYFAHKRLTAPNPSPAAKGGEAEATERQRFNAWFEPAALATPSPQPADAVRERIARALNSVLGSEEDEHPRHHPAQKSWEKPSEVWWTQWLEAADVVLAALATPSPQPAHPDDLAVDRFAVAMKAKLADARAKGKGGWSDDAECSQQYLSDELRHHALKPDPLDVANFAMFLHQRNEEIALPSPQTADAVREAVEEARSLLKVEYYDDGRIAAVGHDSDGLRKMVALLDAALSTPTEGPASQTEGMGGDATKLRENIEAFLEMHRRGVLTPRTPNIPIELLQKALAALTQPETAEAVPPLYLIRKGGAFYRPNSQGYTRSIAEAGRYSLAEAEAITHPNGPNGPRDGMDYIPAPALASDPAPATDDRERLVEALARTLFIAHSVATNNENGRDRIVHWDEATASSHYDGLCSSPLSGASFRRTWEAVARAALATEASR